MEFPRLVYRCPGPHQRPGGTFDHRKTSNATEFDAALESGWFATLPEAIEVKREVAPASLSDMLKAAELLDAQPVPMEGRMIWPPESENNEQTGADFGDADQPGESPQIETKRYGDGTSATDPAPLSDLSPAQQDAVDNAPPTRAELEQMAKELGITYAANIGDKKLAEKIDAALKG